MYGAVCGRQTANNDRVRRDERAPAMELESAHAAIARLQLNSPKTRLLLMSTVYYLRVSISSLSKQKCVTLLLAARLPLDSTLLFSFFNLFESKHCCNCCSVTPSIYLCSSRRSSASTSTTDSSRNSLHIHISHIMLAP